MVEYDPADRWSNLSQVYLLIKALAADHAANELDDLVKRAYGIVNRGDKSFCQSFYDRLFANSAHLRGKFPTDMSHQYEMLDVAVG
jgi:hypothetical protein